MKYPKPGFGVFIRTRIKHPLKGSLELLFNGKDDIKYIDYGSTHTAMLTALYLLLWIPVIFHVRFTALGWAAWLLLPVLHRFLFRYFWTKFEIYEGEFAPVKAEVLLKRNESRKEAGALKKAVAVFEAVLVLAAVVGAFIITKYPPFTIDSFISVKIERDLETAGDLYQYANGYLQEQFPGTQLIAYRLGFEEGGWKHDDGTITDYTWCFMFFRNPRQGLFIRNQKEIIWAETCSEYDSMFLTFFTAEDKYAKAEAIEFVPVPGDYPEGFYD